MLWLVKALGHTMLVKPNQSLSTTCLGANGNYGGDTAQTQDHVYHYCKCFARHYRHDSTDCQYSPPVQNLFMKKDADGANVNAQRKKNKL